MIIIFTIIIIIQRPTDFSIRHIRNCPIERNLAVFSATLISFATWLNLNNPSMNGTCVVLHFMLLVNLWLVFLCSPFTHSEWNFSFQSGPLRNSARDMKIAANATSNCEIFLKFLKSGFICFNIDITNGCKDGLFNKAQNIFIFLRDICLQRKAKYYDHNMK